MANRQRCIFLNLFSNKYNQMAQNRVTGLQLTLSSIRRFGAAKQEAIKEVIFDYTKRIEQDAIRNAPGAGDVLTLAGGGHLMLPDNLRGMIDSEFTNGGFTGKVFVPGVASKFFVYCEFSTGADAARYIPTLPPDWQAFARKYYINGKGKIIGQPFLWPAYFSNKQLFLDELRVIVEGR